MYHLRLTLETAAANVELDEKLLAMAERSELPGEVLRLWESPHTAVVMGRSSHDSEVHIDACAQQGVPVVRRASGGAPVVIGPGCLNYALVLDSSRRPELRAIDRAHKFVLGRMVSALSPQAPGVGCAGTSDLVLAAAGEAPRKFSGNSLRIKRDRLLYHGTILYDFPVASMGRWLARPRRQPDYRQGRDHEAFLTNVPVSRAELEAALIDGWQADAPLNLQL